MGIKVHQPGTPLKGSPKPKARKGKKHHKSGKDWFGDRTPIADMTR